MDVTAQAAAARARSAPPSGHGLSRLLVAVLTGLALGACSPEPEARPAPLVVLAADSLAVPFAELAGAFAETAPGRRVLVRYGHSQNVAAQVRQGSPADAIATAHPQIVADLATRGLIDGPATAFATNRLVFVSRHVPGEPPLDVRDLPRSKWRLVVPAPDIPAGGYAREALRTLGLLHAAESRIVSEEPDVSAVLARIRRSGADAGFVFATDVRASDDLDVSELPAPVTVRARYVIAPLARSPRPQEARAFIAFVRSDAGRAALERYGFGLP